MKVVILAGGKGTRLSEETHIIPKPMLSVGDKPIIHHVMDIYKKYGHDDFLIAAGYKREHVLSYFIGLSNFKVLYNGNASATFEFDDFKVTVVDTGLETMTGGRLRRIQSYINDTFLMTYGDGVGDVGINNVIECHKANKALVTLTAVRPVPRFGSLSFDGDGKVQEFSEKIVGDSDWINGGFFVIEPQALDYILDDKSNWEKDILPVLALKGELYAVPHPGYWQCVDTQRDLQQMREDYERKGALWLHE